jgi:hypothetical protein
MHCECRAGIFKKSMGARQRVGIGISYRPARLHRLAELMPWNRFLGSINVLKYGLWVRRRYMGQRNIMLEMRMGGSERDEDGHPGWKLKRWNDERNYIKAR